MNRHKIVAAALAAIMAVSIGTTTAGAEARAGNSVGGDVSLASYELPSTPELHLERNFMTLKSISDKSVGAYEKLTVRIWGRTLSVSGLDINGESYIPFRAAANMLGASYSYNSSTRTSTMWLDGLTLTAGAGCYVAYGNGRALFNTAPVVIMSDGRMYIPATMLAKATGLIIAESAGAINLGGGLKPLKDASEFYREDEVFWLARIIHAESAGEPLLGQIAVGDVVLNRVRSFDYPGTIYGVIFDRKYGVQFSPILNGTIYNTPSYNSVLAAKICLEGATLSDEVMFFLQPDLAASSWIPRTREYCFTVGRHDFYK